MVAGELHFRCRCSNCEKDDDDDASGCGGWCPYFFLLHRDTSVAARQGSSIHYHQPSHTRVVVMAANHHQCRGTGDDVDGSKNASGILAMMLMLLLMLMLMRKK